MVLIIRSNVFRTITLFLTAVLSLSAAAYAAPSHSATATVLMHADTGELLYQQNADSDMLIASTTKIMTALVVLENCDPDEIVVIKPEYTNIEGSSVYLCAGEEWTVRDLLFGLMLASGNDAATALAFHCGGSVEGFAELMNNKAAQLGLQNSSFKNPHGLDAEGHYSCARDLAEIMRAAMEYPLFAEIVGTKYHTVGQRSYMNHNKLLWSCDYIRGGKTGYTMAAGRSLVTCAEKDGLRLICVTLSDPNDWDDHKAMYTWAFENFRYVRAMPLDKVCELPVVSGSSDRVSVVCSGDSRVLIKSDAKLDLILELPEFVYAGIKKDDCAGRAFVTADGALVGEFPLFFAESVPLSAGADLTAWEKLRRVWFMANKYGFVFQD